MTEVHADNPVDLFSHNKDALGYIQVWSITCGLEQGRLFHWKLLPMHKFKRYYNRAISAGSGAQVHEKMTNVKISQIWSRLGQFLIHDVSPSTIMMSGCMPGVNKTSTHWSISPGSMARRLECHSNWIYPVDGGKEREDVKSSKQTSCHWPTTHTDGWKRAED